MKNVFRIAFTFSLVAMTTSILLSSCKKDEIIIPAACITASETSINVGDSVVFTNCSISDEATIFITSQGNGDSHDGIVYPFNTNKEYTHVFNQSDVYTATVQASNNQAGSPISTSVKTITVE